MSTTTLEGSVLELEIPELLAEPAAAPSDKASEFRRILTLVGVGFFIQTLVTDNGIFKLPINNLLKNQLHLAPFKISLFLLITNFCWYFKPVVGLVADTFRIKGSRYRNYLLIAALGAATLIFLMAVFPRAWTPMLVAWTGVNFFLCVISVVLGGYMVIEGKRFGATGRMSAFRNNALYATGLLAFAGGWLADHAFGLSAGIGIGLLLGLFAFMFYWLQDPVTVARPDSDSTVWQKLCAQYGPLFQTRSFWVALLMTFFVMVVPNLGTPLYIYQTDQLHLSQTFIGWTYTVSAIGSLVGGVLYASICKRMSLRSLLFWGIIANAAGTIIYLGYLGPVSALVVDGLNGFLGVIPVIALMDLAARATPATGASFAYAALMAVYNLSYKLGDTCGSYMIDPGKLGMPFSRLVWISTITTMVVILLVPLLPKSLVDSSDATA